MQQLSHLIGAGHYTAAHALLLTAIGSRLFLSGTSGHTARSLGDPLVTLSDKCEQLAGHATAIGPAWTLGVGLYHSYCQLFVKGPLAEALAAVGGGEQQEQQQQQVLLSKLLAFSQQLNLAGKQQPTGAAAKGAGGVSGEGHGAGVSVAGGGVVADVGLGSSGSCWVSAEGRAVLSRMNAAVARALMQLGGSDGAAAALVTGQEGMTAARLGAGSLGLGGLSSEQQQQVLGLAPAVPGGGWVRLMGGSGVGRSVPGVVGGDWPMEMAAAVLGARAVGASA